MKTYTSLKEAMLLHWKTLKQYIEPEALAQELERCNFLPNSSFENLGSKSWSHQAVLVLMTVCRSIQSHEKKNQDAVEILRCHNIAAAKALTDPVGGLINNIGSGR